MQKSGIRNVKICCSSKMTSYTMIGVVILSCDQISDFFFHNGDREAAKNDVLLQKMYGFQKSSYNLCRSYCTVRHLLEYDRSCPLDVQ